LKKLSAEQKIELKRMVGMPGFNVLRDSVDAIRNEFNRLQGNAYPDQWRTGIAVGRVEGIDHIRLFLSEIPKFKTEGEE
jgi:hypothetical protein